MNLIRGEDPIWPQLVKESDPAPTLIRNEKNMNLYTSLPSVQELVTHFM